MRKQNLGPHSPSKPKSDASKRQLRLKLTKSDASAEEKDSARKSEGGNNNCGGRSRSLHDWLKRIDQILTEKAGLTTGLFRTKGWEHLFRRGVQPSEASDRALKVYRKGNENLEKRRRWLLILLSAEQEALLSETIEKAPEQVIRDALRLSSRSQQKRIEVLLERRVSEMAN